MKARQIIMIAALLGLLGFIYWLMSHQSVRPEAAHPASESAAEAKSLSLDGSMPHAEQTSSQASQQKASIPTQRPDVDSSAHKQEVAQNIDPMTGLPPDKNDPAMLAKRKQVFMDITDIMTNMARGEKPESGVIITHANDIVMLTEAGYVPKEDSLNSLDFLRKAFPELDIELSRISENVL